MTWVYFEEGDRQVAAPAFSLERIGGGRVALHDYYEKSCLVALFPAKGMDTTTQSSLEHFASRQEEIERQGAEIVALIPEPETGSDSTSPAELRTADLPPAAWPPFPLLADWEGRVREKYAGQMVEDLVPPGSALLFILDVFGAPWAAYVGERLDEDGLVDDVLSWLAFIGIQCPE